MFTRTLSVPIWQGGRSEGEIQQTDAALSQRVAEAEDLRGKIESDVRTHILTCKLRLIRLTSRRRI
jgi:outer membrane protein TolC